MLLSLFGLVLLACPAWAWFAEGHEIVAIIAADALNCSPVGYYDATGHALFRLRSGP
jgi:hypothetical protein